MGELTLVDMKDELRAAFGGRVDEDARLARWINLAQTRIARTFTFSETKLKNDFVFPFGGTASTDKSTPFVDIAPTFNPKEIYSVRLLDEESSAKVTFRPSRMWDRVVPATEELARGTPLWYTKWGKEFEWYSIPDQAYAGIIRAANWPGFLAADTDLSLLDNKDDIIINMAISWGMHTIGKREDAKQFFAIANNMLRDAISEEAVEPDADYNPDWATPSIPLGEYWTNAFISEAP